MITVQGSEALRRKLDALGKDAPKAVRIGLRKSAQFTAWFIKGTAPKFTGSTIKAIGNKETGGRGVYGQFVGVLKDKEYKKNLYYRWSVGKNGGKYMEFSLTKDKGEGFVNRTSVKKKPVIYSGIVEKQSPWFMPSWKAIRGRTAAITITETSKAIAAILNKRSL
jgi:hypothetical protein